MEGLAQALGEYRVAVQRLRVRNGEVLEGLKVLEGVVREWEGVAAV